MDLRLVWSLLGLTLLPALSVAAGKCERLVVTGSPDAPPYLWQDPQNPKYLIGASADLLQQVAGELGLKVELLYAGKRTQACLLYTSPSPRDGLLSRMPSSA